MSRLKRAQNPFIGFLVSCLAAAVIILMILLFMGIDSSPKYTDSQKPDSELVL